MIEECAQESRRIFNFIYTEKLREYSKWRYPGLTPEVGDIVGVPDKEVHGEPRIGRVIELPSLHEARVEIARPKRRHPYPIEEVTTKKVIFRRSPHSLYLVERRSKDEKSTDLREVEAGEIFEGTPLSEGEEESQSVQLDSPVEGEKLDNDEACEDPEPHDCEGDRTQMEHNLTKEDVEVPTNNEDIERMSSPAPREEVKLDNDEGCADSEPPPVV